MTLEAIKRSIMDEAEDKASDLEKEASMESERIVSEAEERAKRIMKDAERDAEREAQRLRMESKASAEVEANALLLEARGEAVERSLGGVMSQLAKEVQKASIRKLLEQGIKDFAEASGGREIVVRTGRRNAEAVKGLDARVEYADIDGFILSTSDSKIELDATLGSILESQKDTARRLVYEELFHGAGAAEPARRAPKRKAAHAKMERGKK